MSPFKCHGPLLLNFVKAESRPGLAPRTAAPPARADAFVLTGGA